MSSVFRCDRCGEYFEWNDCAEKFLRAKEKDFVENPKKYEKVLWIEPELTSNRIKTITIGLLDGEKVDGEYDLCPSCMTALNDWLKGNADGKV